MYDGRTAMPPIGSAEDALFQQKVKALIKTNEDLRTQIQGLTRQVAEMEQKYGAGGLITHELSCLREENARLRREGSLRQAIASSSQTLQPQQQAMSMGSMPYTVPAQEFGNALGATPQALFATPQTTTTNASIAPQQATAAYMVVPAPLQGNSAATTAQTIPNVLFQFFPQLLVNPFSNS